MVLLPQYKVKTLQWGQALEPLNKPLQTFFIHLTRAPIHHHWKRDAFLLFTRSWESSPWGNATLWHLRRHVLLQMVNSPLYHNIKNTRMLKLFESFSNPIPIPPKKKILKTSEWSWPFIFLTRCSLDWLFVLSWRTGGSLRGIGMRHPELQHICYIDLCLFCKRYILWPASSSFWGDASSFWAEDH